MLHRHVRRSAASLLAAASLVAAALLPVRASAQDPQPATVTGRVTGENGAPLPGVQLFIAALGLGSVSRDDGRYTILVPAPRATGQTVTLATRQVGLRAATAQVTLTPGSVVTQDFQLVALPVTLSAVVVTGAGTTSTRERLGNVINSVDSSLLQRASEPQNVVSALAGKAPNVDIRTQSGEPGASASIRIRGATSVTGTNQPLFVVDGQPIDNSTLSTDQTAFPGSASTVTQNRAADVNPNDVESVEILKGSAAAAIYGAQAANGVVLITTRRGRPGPTRYTVSSSASFDEVQDVIDLQRSYGQGSGGVAPVCSTTNCAATSLSWGPRLDGGVPTFDHEREIFDTGLTLDNTLTVSGGTDRTSFFLSAGLTNQNGTIVGPNNRYDRTSVRLKASHQLLGNLVAGGNFSYVDSRGRYVQKGSNTSGLLLGALRTPPDFDNRDYLDPTYGLHRSYRFPNPDPTSLTTGRGYDNPFFTLNNPGNRSELGRFIGNVTLDYSPLSWLTANYTLGSDYWADTRLESLPFTSSGQPVGQVIRLDANNLVIDHNLIAKATHDFSPNLTTSLTIGQNLNSRRARQNLVQGIGLIAPDPLALQNTLTYNPTEAKSLRHIEAYFAQATADFYDQLFLTLGVRNDGFSTFGASKRRATFPKASLAWTFTKALGIDEDNGVVSYGKLRGAYGETGREPPVYGTIDAFSLTTLIGSGYSDFLRTSQSGRGGVVSSLQLGNNDLEPERSRETEVGADFGFFRQRGELSVTYYNKRSSDVIVAVPVNGSQTGAQTALRNAASISNKGVEVTLNTRPYSSRNVEWSVGLNYGRNRGKVLSLAGAEFIPYNNEGFTGSAGSSTLGYAPGVIRGSDFARCGRGLQIDYDGDNVVDDIDALCGPNAAPGALFIALQTLPDGSTRGLPVEDPTDRVIADPNPKWSGGLTSSLQLFGRLTLSGLVDVRRGFQVWNGTRGALYRFGTHKDTEVRNRTGTFGQDWYTKEYPNVAGPGAGTVAFTTPGEWQTWFTTTGGSAGNTQAQFVEDGSFVKLRELSLAYTFDQPAVQRALGVSSANLRIAGRNLHTWTKYTGLDPETNLGGAEWLTQGVDFFQNPQTRSFVLSLTLSR